MAVTRVKEQFYGRSSSTTYKGTAPDGTTLVERKAERRFIVICDSVTDGTIAAENASFGGTSIPLVGDEHPDDPRMLLLDRKADPYEDEPMAFIVLCSYGMPSNNAGTEDGEEESPLDAPAEYTYGFSVSSEPVYKDAQGNPITNSAGETYDPPVQADIYDPVITVSKNVATFDAGLASYLVGGVNISTWYGNAPRTARINNIQATQEQQGALVYWRISAEIQIRYDKWDLNVLDQGYCERVDDGGTYKFRLIRDKENKPKNVPTLLDGNGTALNPAVYNDETGDQIISGGTPVFRKVRIHREVAFASLGI